MAPQGVRWSTKFGRWTRSYGVRRLASDLGRSGPATAVSRSCIYEWLAGRSEPRLHTALTIERLSRGEVQIEDICAHQETVRR